MTTSVFLPGILVDKEELISYRHQATSLKLDTVQTGRSMLAGRYRSRFRGRGMEFSESRQYQPGDDRRHIDWKVTARTGFAHTKVFVEERERPVFIIIDFSASLYFGTRRTFKSVLATKAATLLAWAAVQQGDRVGAVLMKSDQVFDLKPKAGRRGVLALIDALTEACQPNLTPNQSPQLNRALKHLCAVAHPGSLVFLFSDFYRIDGLTRKLLTQVHEHNDMVACHLVDPLELQAPAAGRYFITDGMTQTVLNTHHRRTKQDYNAYFLNHQALVERLAASMKMPLLRLVNGTDFRMVLNTAFGGHGKNNGL